MNAESESFDNRISSTSNKILDAAIDTRQIPRHDINILRRILILLADPEQMKLRSVACLIYNGAIAIVEDGDTIFGDLPGESYE